ncbi:MAG: hypothetical protein ACLPND_11575 [Candidatus Korobacteraceae bacterium]
MLAIAVLVSLLLFFALDWLWSAHVLRSAPPISPAATCFARDTVRHHALQPECSCDRHWGKQSYPFATNSLGFRDENIRKVPVTGARPRILVLGDSFTEGMSSWPDSYIGQIAARFPQYEFLNGAVESYSPSNYLNVTRGLLNEGVLFDEVIVFIDMSDAQDEAAFYRDIDASGAVDGPQQIIHNGGWYANLRLYITDHLLLTNTVVGFLERQAVKHGLYSLNVGHGPLFDLERSAWTYRPVSDSAPYEIGYGPLGLQAGLAKEQSKMTLLWQELQQRNIPLSVAVYPWPAQIVHDTAESKQVVMWRDWCAGKCKSFISVFPAFFAVKDQCPSGQPGCWYLNDFIFGDEHYNAAGNALVADAVSKSLEEHPPLKRE